MSWTTHGDLYPKYAKSYCTHGHALVYGSDAPLRHDKERQNRAETEWLFLYDARDNDDKPFDMDFAIKCTEDEWWGITYGADKMNVSESKIIGSDGPRTWFVLYVIPMYKRKGKLVDVTEL